MSVGELHWPPSGRVVRQGLAVEVTTLIVLEVAMQRDEDGFAVWVAELPGCWSQGDSEEQALENIADAIVEYLAAENEDALVTHGGVA
jgi:predicted RNase H-like HicB family nuclease